MIFGDPGCGKSFVAVDIALSVASGTLFHDKAVKQGSVFFIAGEGHNGLARRFAAWCKDRGVSLSGVPMFKSERAAQFLDADSARIVAQSVDAMAEAHGEPTLIIVDTVARNFGAGDENSTSDMSNFIVAIDDLKPGIRAALCCWCITRAMPTSSERAEQWHSRALWTVSSVSKRAGAR